MERKAIVRAIEMIFDAYEVGEISISSRPLIIEHIANLVEQTRDEATDQIYEQLSLTKIGRAAMEELGVIDEYK